MFTWINGGLFLVLAVCPIAAVLIVGTINAHLVRKAQDRINAEHGAR